MSASIRKEPAFNRSSIGDLPNGPGVYLFYGSSGELLYVGKSKLIRSRVRAHFSAPDERWLRKRIRRVEVRPTAGELGALLLESRLIKELRPMFNVAARQRRRIIVAWRVDNGDGYACIRLEAVDRLDVSASSPVIAIFKHRTQAKDYLSVVARNYRLCPKLLGLEGSRKHCFSYHLGYCDGACMGEEDPGGYNARFEKAFEARRVKAWPYTGGIVVEERSNDGRESELFLIDNWCLLASFKRFNGAAVVNERSDHRFDYDSYKLLYSYVTDASNKSKIHVLQRKEFEALKNSFPARTQT